MTKSNWQRHDEGFQEAEATVHQEQHQERIDGRDEGADHQRNAEQKLQRDGRADHLGEVAGNDRQLAGEVEDEIDRRRIGIAAGLGEVAAGDDAKAGGQRLQQDRHQVGQQDDRQQRVAEARAAGDVGRPVARIHVADRDQVARSGKGEQLQEPGAAARDSDAGVDLGQARRVGAERELPPGFTARCGGSPSPTAGRSHRNSRAGCKASAT